MLTKLQGLHCGLKIATARVMNSACATQLYLLLALISILQAVTAQLDQSTSRNRQSLRMKAQDVTSQWLQNCVGA